MYTVVCVGSFHARGFELLDARADLLTYTVLEDLSPQGVASGIRGANAIIVRTTPLPADALAAAPELRVVSRHGVGTDNIDVAWLTSRGIPVAIAADSNVGSVAEHTLMLMLGVAKDVMAGDRATRGGNFAWRDRRTPMDLAGKTILLLGFGRIGQQVGKLCQALGMRVLAHDPWYRDSPLPGVVMVPDFREALPEADVLSLHLPATAETRGLIGAAELGRLRRGAIVINCARGGIVDEDALCDALESGALRGGGLDVFSEEPPRGDSRLLGQPNLILSPHNAALTGECAIRMAEQAVQNVIACFEGTLEPRLVVNSRELGWGHARPSGMRQGAGGPA